MYGEGRLCATGFQPMGFNSKHGLKARATEIVFYDGAEWGGDCSNRERLFDWPHGRRCILR